MSQPIFYVGQQVGCLMYGEGVVERIESDITYAIRVKFQDTQLAYTADGRCNTIHARPMLYPIEQYRSIIATLPSPEPEKWQPKPGEWCWFWGGDSAVVIAQFAEYLLPSKNYKTKTGSWYRSCAPFTGELPEHLKEVQP